MQHFSGWGACSVGGELHENTSYLLSNKLKEFSLLLMAKVISFMHTCSHTHSIMSPHGAGKSSTCLGWAEGGCWALQRLPVGLLRVSDLQPHNPGDMAVVWLHHDDTTRQWGQGTRDWGCSSSKCDGYDVTCHWMLENIAPFHSYSSTAFPPFLWHTNTHTQAERDVYIYIYKRSALYFFSLTEPNKETQSHPPPPSSQK